MSDQKRVWIIVLLVTALLVAGVVIFLHQPQKETAVSTPVPQATPVAPAPAVVQPAAPAVAPIVKPAVPVGTDQFVISMGDTDTTIAQNLASKGYVSDQNAFVALLGTTTPNPGAYLISILMTPAQLVTVLEGAPYMKWVVIPPGLRKEEIANILATTLGWTQKQEATWIASDPNNDPNDIEGVYFPDTYLIPVDETPEATANRLIAMFNQQFSPLLPQFNAQNIKWTTGLTLASIVQREAANDADMPLIAGILWNRLNQGMALDVDATIQYARGNTGAGWWAPISVADESIVSPFNTYLNKGVPPHPIDSPGLPAIEAVLNPATTDCLYYIHDNNRITHCATTLAGQNANIQEYLIDPSSQTTTN